MAGHSKFKNIQHRKGAQDKKRAKIFTKLVREIVVAAKSGLPDPGANPRLRSAIIAARSQNLPKERIEKAINAASDTAGSNDYSEMRYEGFAPHGVAIVIEALTDNKNRTAAEVRAAFTKFGGSLGETGSVSYLFNHCGVIYYQVTVASVEEMMKNALESGANDVCCDETGYYIYTNIEDFSSTLELLTNKYGDPEESYIGWVPINKIFVDEQEKAEKLLKLVELLEDSDDVQRVFGNYEFSGLIS